ncbi:MAG: hypothetical protein MZV70_28895 [Desulfobacterales bacterium]|nr:hypothetical protein [Desulfobacterales bacterium]
MGKLEGEVDLAGEFVVAPPAVLNGDGPGRHARRERHRHRHARRAREKIHLEKGAVVNGRLTTPRLSVADGATVQRRDRDEKAPEADGAASPKARATKK